MDFKDRPIWYAIAAAIIVLVIIAYAAGWLVARLHRLPSKHTAACGNHGGCCRTTVELAELTAVIV
jgi:hypothetical protein